MNIVVSGSRDWTNREMIEEILVELASEHEVLTVSHGDNPRGADRIVDDLCRELGITVHRYPADWDGLGNRAGFLRNEQMLVEEMPDLVIALPTPYSKGTVALMGSAKELGFPVRAVEDPAKAEAAELRKKIEALREKAAASQAAAVEAQDAIEAEARS